MRNRGNVAVILGLASCCLLGEPRAISQVATFESLSEGFYGTAFLDTSSGILFTNVTKDLAGTAFAVDYGAPISLPVNEQSVFPGSYLTAEGVAGEGAFSLCPGMGFEFILPRPSKHVQMDQIYIGFGGQSFSINVTAYAIGGDEVLHTNVFLPGTGETVGVLRSAFSVDTPMSRFVVASPISGGGVGFDNIGAPPFLESLSVSNQIAVLTASGSLPGAKLLSSTNFLDWSVTAAEVTSESGTMIFKVPIAEPHTFFRVQQD